MDMHLEEVCYLITNVVVNRVPIKQCDFDRNVLGNKNFITINTINTIETHIIISSSSRPSTSIVSFSNNIKFESQLEPIPRLTFLT